jgi:16S rRNA (guanine527-N7)-methyltransferase
LHLTNNETCYMEIGTREWSSFLINQAKTIEIDLDHTQNRLFSTHAIELIKWTQKINLTTITNPIEVASNHFLDSLVPARFIPPGARMLDIGSGGGFPGIPLKVLLPKLSVTLIDASRKKVSFLKHVIRTLKLDNIEALHIRAEDLAKHPSYINRFDAIISRALSSLDSFVNLALPLLADEGVIIAMKGEVDKTELDDLRHNVLEKINAAGSLDRQFTISLKRYILPLLNSERSIIIVR